MARLDPNPMAYSRGYLVVVTERVVADDIAQTIADFDPASNVVCANSLAEAEAALPAIGPVELAFIAGCPTSFVGSALHRGLSERGGRVILLGIEAEMTGPTPVFDVLPQPFDTDAVIAKLQPSAAQAAQSLDDPPGACAGTVRQSAFRLMQRTSPDSPPSSPRLRQTVW